MKRRPSSPPPRRRRRTRGAASALAAALAVGTIAQPLALAQRRPARPAGTTTTAQTTTQPPSPSTPSPAQAQQQPAPQEQLAPQRVDAPPPGDAVPPPPPAQVLTLREAIALARRNPPSILNALAQARVAEAQVAVARAPLIPSLTGNASLSGSLSNGTQNFGGLPFTNTSFQAAVDATLAFRWMIWDFGRTGANIAAAQGRARATRASALATERIAVRAAGVAFYAVLLDEEVLAQNRETVRQRERQFEIARGLVDAGARAPIEATRAQVALDTARLDVAVAEATLRNDAAVLAASLAIDPAREIRVARPAELPAIDDPARAADEAVASLPEIAAARLQVEAAERQLAAARLGYLPSLNMQLNGGVRYTFGQTDRGMGMGFQEVGGPFQFASGSIVLSVPIFDYTIPANVRVADAQVALARTNVDQQVLAVRTEAVQAAIQVRTARQTLASAERVAVGAAANLVQAEGRYRAGAAALLELVDAQAADAVARVNVARARFQVESAKVRLLTATGRLAAFTGTQ